MKTSRKLISLLFSFFVLYCQHALPMIQMFDGHASATQAAGAGQGVGAAQAAGQALAIPAQPLRMAGEHAPLDERANAQANPQANTPPRNTLLAQQSLLSKAFDRCYPQGFHDQKHRSELLQKIQKVLPFYTLHNPSGWINTFAWSPDSSLMATGSPTGWTNIWDAQTGAFKASVKHDIRSDNPLLVRSPGSQRLDICSLAFSHSSEYAYAGSANGDLRVLDIPNNSFLCGVRVSDACDSFDSIDLSPNGQHLAVACNKTFMNNYLRPTHSGTVFIWKPNENETLGNSLDLDNKISSVQWNRGGTDVLLASDDGTTRIWNPFTNKVNTLDHQAAVQGAWWSPDDKSILTEESFTRVHVWDAQTCEKKFTLKGHKKPCWSPDGTMIASGMMTPLSGFSYEICIYQAHSGERKFTLAFDKNNQGFSEIISSLAWSPDSKYIAAGGFNGTIGIWDIETGTRKAVLLGNIENPSVSWSPNSQSIASYNILKSKVHIWNVSHLFDEKYKNECQAFKEGRLQPEQYMLLDLLQKHSANAHSARRSVMENRDAESDLQKLMELSQEQAPGVSLKDAINALMMFSPTLARMILDTHRLAYDKLVFQLAKEKLFEEEHTSLQPVSSKPLLSGLTVQTALGGYLFGDYETQYDRAQREKEAQTKKEQVALQARIALAQKLKKECPIKTQDLFEAIQNCDHKKTTQALNAETIIARPMEAGKNAQGKVIKTDMRTPLMEVIVRSEKRYSDYDIIFNTLLNFKDETLLEGNIKAVRESDLAAQDLNFNTPLMLAINMRRFDYALKIAQKMDSDQQWHAAFNAKDKGGKTAYDLLQAVTAKQDGQSVDQASTLAQIHSIILKHKK